MINSEDLVVGDLLVLREGTIVPADCWVATATNLKCCEFQITGNAEIINKNTLD